MKKDRGRCAGRVKKGPPSRGRIEKERLCWRLEEAGRTAWGAPLWRVAFYDKKSRAPTGFLALGPAAVCPVTRDPAGARTWDSGNRVVARLYAEWCLDPRGRVFRAR